MLDVDMNAQMNQYGECMCTDFSDASSLRQPRLRRDEDLLKKGFLKQARVDFLALRAEVLTPEQIAALYAKDTKGKKKKKGKKSGKGKGKGKASKAAGKAAKAGKKKKGKGGKKQGAAGVAASTAEARALVAAVGGDGDEDDDDSGDDGDGEDVVGSDAFDDGGDGDGVADGGSGSDGEGDGENNDDDENGDDDNDVDSEGDERSTQGSPARANVDADATGADGSDSEGAGTPSKPKMKKSPLGVSDGDGDGASGEMHSRVNRPDTPGTPSALLSTGGSATTTDASPTHIGASMTRQVSTCVSTVRVRLRVPQSTTATTTTKDRDDHINRTPHFTHATSTKHQHTLLHPHQTINRPNSKKSARVKKGEIPLGNPVEDTDQWAGE
jgi:hypothetical protein